MLGSNSSTSTPQFRADKPLVVISPVSNADDPVVGLRRLVEQLADPGAALVHAGGCHVIGGDGGGDSVCFHAGACRGATLRPPRSRMA